MGNEQSYTTHRQHINISYHSSVAWTMTMHTSLAFSVAELTFPTIHTNQLISSSVYRLLYILNSVCCSTQVRDTIAFVFAIMQRRFVEKLLHQAVDCSCVKDKKVFYTMKQLTCQGWHFRAGMSGRWKYITLFCGETSHRIWRDLSRSDRQPGDQSKSMSSCNGFLAL